MTEPTPALPPDPPCGCGWFDSSQDLREGCEVIEHASPGTLAAQLPLADWLALYLQTRH